MTLAAGQGGRLATALLVSVVAAAPMQSPPAAAASTPLAASIVLNYSFDSDAPDVVRDSSPNALNGTLVNAAPNLAYVTSVPGRGKALRLIGAQRQFIAVPEHAAIDVDRFTLTALVRYTGVENDHTNGRWEVLEKSGAYWMNLRADGRVRAGGFFGACAVQPAWRYIDSTRIIPINTWTHIAATYDGSRLSVWVNGLWAGTLAVGGVTCVNDNPLAIGAKRALDGTTEAFYDGRLDDVRIYRKALSSAAIRALVP